MKNTYLEGGRVLSAHGVRGLMKIESYCDAPRVLAGMKRVFIKHGDVYEERTVTSASPAGEIVLMGIDGVPDREAAQGMKNTILYLHREDIPLAPGSVFIADLIGLPVTDAVTGKVYGTVADITDAVRGRLYTVRTEKGDVLLPGVPEFIKETDAERGVLITPIPGFFD